MPRSGVDGVAAVGRRKAGDVLGDLCRVCIDRTQLLLWHGIARRGAARHPGITGATGTVAAKGASLPAGAVSVASASSVTVAFVICTKTRFALKVFVHHDIDR